MTTLLAECVASYVAHAINTLGISVAVQMLTVEGSNILNEPPSLCSHPRWFVASIETRFTRVDRYGQRIRGDMVERSQLVCMECGEERENVVVLPPEWDF